LVAGPGIAFFRSILIATVGSVLLLEVEKSELRAELGCVRAPEKDKLRNEMMHHIDNVEVRLRLPSGYAHFSCVLTAECARSRLEGGNQVDEPRMPTKSEI
jgi:hypothetical protein